VGLDRLHVRAHLVIPAGGMGSVAKVTVARLGRGHDELVR